MNAPSNKRTSESGFSLIELMMVIAVMALFASFALSAFDQARFKARDVRRLAEIQGAQKALELYYIAHNKYPTGDFDGCGGWDVGNSEYPFFNGSGMDNNFAGGRPPVDIWKVGNCDGYRYYHYPAGSYGCQASHGDFYVLGVTDMESTGDPFPGSPGFLCPGRNFQDEFDWVAGQFEN